MKTFTPKSQDWILEAKLRFFESGFHHGAYGVELVFGSTPGTEALVRHLITEITSLRMPSNRLVRIRGAFLNGDPAMYLLVRTLKSYGYNVHGVLHDGYAAPQVWFDHVAWITLRTKEPLLLYPVNEVWYEPPEDTPIKDLQIPESPTPVFVFVTKGRHPLEALEEFVCASRYKVALL